MFESRRGHIRRVFHLWLHFITFGGHSAHLACHMHKIGLKKKSSSSYLFTELHLPLLVLSVSQSVSQSVSHLICNHDLSTEQCIIVTIVPYRSTPSYVTLEGDSWYLNVCHCGHCSYCWHEHLVCDKEKVSNRSQTAHKFSFCLKYLLLSWISLLACFSYNSQIQSNVIISCLTDLTRHRMIFCMHQLTRSIGVQRMVSIDWRSNLIHVINLFFCHLLM